MFFFKKKKPATEEQPSLSIAKCSSKKETRSTLPSDLSSVLSKTKAKVQGLFAGLKKISPDNEVFFEQLERCFLLSDFDTKLSHEIIEKLRKAKKNQLSSQASILELTKTHLTDLMAQSLYDFPSSKTDMHTIMLLGANGSGKTTTLAKLAAMYKNAGKKVTITAGDTYRAAAIEQCKVWGKRLDIPVFSKEIGSDSAASIYQGLSFAKELHADVFLADTAGRLHNNKDLMDELVKIQKVMKKIDPDYPHEIFLVLDACHGKNIIKQAKVFQEALKNISGIILTKLDSSAKGGAIFSVVKELSLPIAYIGTGEGAENIQKFNPNNFVNAFFEGLITS